MADEPTTADPWVEMTHPDLPDSPPAPALRTTFDLVWEPRGWRLHTGDEPAAPAADTVTAPELESVSDTPAAARRKTAAPAAPKED
ncbi:hypothetical protein ACIQJX_07520 [Streptomyces griseoviridis]